MKILSLVFALLIATALPQTVQAEALYLHCTDPGTRPQTKIFLVYDGEYNVKKSEDEVNAWLASLKDPTILQVLQTKVDQAAALLSFVYCTRQNK